MKLPKIDTLLVNAMGVGIVLILVSLLVTIAAGLFCLWGVTCLG